MIVIIQYITIHLHYTNLRCNATAILIHSHKIYEFFPDKDQIDFPYKL